MEIRSVIITRWRIFCVNSREKNEPRRYVRKSKKGKTMIIYTEMLTSRLQSFSQSTIYIRYQGLVQRQKVRDFQRIRDLPMDLRAAKIFAPASEKTSQQHFTLPVYRKIFCIWVKKKQHSEHEVCWRVKTNMQDSHQLISTLWKPSSQWESKDHSWTKPHCNLPNGKAKPKKRPELRFLQIDNCMTNIQ